jgi:hypothetical protein
MFKKYRFFAIIVFGLILSPGQVVNAARQSGTEAVMKSLAVPVAPSVSPLPPDWSAESDQAGAAFGTTAAAGDVNGDGYADLAVGAPEFDNGEDDEGRIFVYLGTASGLSSTSAWTAESDQTGARLGSSLSLGDVNGDGYADLSAGAPWYSNGQSKEGKVFVYYGSAEGLSAQPLWTSEGDKDGALFGWAIDLSGDMNGDGFAELAVGAMSYEAGQVDEGRAFLFQGSAAGLSLTPVWMGEGDQAEAGYGFSVGSAGDVNRDGFDDLLVGAPGYLDLKPQDGRVFLYHGSAGGLSRTASWKASGSDYGEMRFGDLAVRVGDVNGDGFGDILVGDYFRTVSAHLLRSTHLYYGSASGLEQAARWHVSSSFPDESYGASAGPAGDVNGDGLSDVIVGAPVALKAYLERAYFYTGGPTGLGRGPNWTAESDQIAADFGRAVGAAGDVDGDGYTDLFVGAPEYSHGQSKEGKLFVYYGSSIITVYRPNRYVYFPLLGR